MRRPDLGSLRLHAIMSATYDGHGVVA